MINVLDSSLLTSKMHENNSDINTYNQMQERKKERKEYFKYKMSIL
jgi:hypothetical protein